MSGFIERVIAVKEQFIPPSSRIVRRREAITHLSIAALNSGMPEDEVAVVEKQISKPFSRRKNKIQAVTKLAQGALNGGMPFHDVEYALIDMGHLRGPKTLPLGSDW